MDSRGKTRSRLVAGMVALVSLTTLAHPAPAFGDGFDPAGIVFPVIGEVTFIDDFDQQRSGGRTHEAIDIMGEKLLPVVAAADGVVAWVGSDCCYLSIDHGGGWETWYIHLNNDTPGTDDGQGWGIAPGIERGASVRRGQLIGWVGDSGNAEWVGPHLHFQIFHDDVAVNPYPYLVEAPRLTEPVPVIHDGTFADDDGSVHEGDIEKLVVTGVTNGCSVEPMLYCPSDPITRGQIAAFINRALALPPSAEDWFVDDDGNRFESSIDALAAAGVTLGCATEPARYCAGDVVTRAQMASFFSRAMGL